MAPMQALLDVRAVGWKDLASLFSAASGMAPDLVGECWRKRPPTSATMSGSPSS